MNRCLLAPRGGALHGKIAKRIIKSRYLRLAKIENLGSKPPAARARLHKRKFRRAAELFPHLRKLPRQETRKNGVHINACVIVRETLGLRFAVITMDRMVEAFSHVVPERHPTEAARD